MLICPQCHAENSESHRFCNACGASLSHSNCPSCGLEVERSATVCPHCGVVTGQHWRVILQAVAGAEPMSLTEPTIAPGEWLDAQERYQIQAALSPAPPVTAAIAVETTVIDQQPLQISPLDNLRDLAQTIDSPAVMATKGAALLIPPPAYPYLALAEVLDPAVPRLHDAWQTEQHMVLLLDDRRDWLPLVDSWADDTVDPLQMVWWLHEMSRLWGILEPWQSCASLLDLENLCVDEDQILCLRQIYEDATSSTPPTLSALGHVWQQLMSASQRTLTAALATLCQDLATGSIATLADLQAQLAAIADQLQPNLASPDPIMTMGLEDDEEIPTAADPAVDSADRDVDRDEERTIPLDPAGRAVTTITPGVAADPEMAVPADEQADADDPDQSFDSGELDALATLDEFDEDDDELEDSPTIVLPMRLLAIDDAGSTDVGQQRKHNEDTFSIQLALQKAENPVGRTLHAKGLYILCDGMGGHDGGEIASALTVEVLRDYFETHWTEQLPSEATIRAGIQLANKAIHDINQQNARFGSGRMGTTLVLMLIQDTYAIVAHVGDSRVYRYSRRLGLEQVTVDHEVGQREIQRGVEPEIAYARPDAYQLTQALGPRDERFIDPSFVYLDLNEDTLLMLCSDGLSDNDLLELHSSTHIEPLLSSGTNLERGVADLMHLANQFNGHDNITVVAVRVKVRPKLTESRSQ